MLKLVLVHILVAVIQTSLIQTTFKDILLVQINTPIFNKDAKINWLMLFGISVVNISAGDIPKNRSLLLSGHVEYFLFRFDVHINHFQVYIQISYVIKISMSTRTQRDTNANTIVNYKRYCQFSKYGDDKTGCQVFGIIRVISGSCPLHFLKRQQ